jgi:hypothetical protein
MNRFNIVQRHSSSAQHNSHLAEHSVDVLYSHFTAYSAQDPDAVQSFGANSFKHIIPKILSSHDNDSRNANVELAVESARVYFSTPNIRTGVNDTIRVTDSAGVGSPYDIVLPEGLYSVDDLNDLIQRNLEQQGATVSPLPLIELSIHAGSLTTYLTINYTTVTIDFSVAQNFAALLGFTAAVVGPPLSAPLDYKSSSDAALSPVGQYMVGCSAVSHFLSYTSGHAQARSKQIIAIIPTKDADPGDLLEVRRTDLTWIRAPQLTGHDDFTAQFVLYDESHNEVSTGGRPWSVDFVVRCRQLRKHK